MADEPGGWELHRSQEQTRQMMINQFADLKGELTRLATAEGVAREVGRIDSNQAQFAQSLMDERRARTEGDRELADRIDKIFGRWWVILSSIIIPSAALIVVVIRG